ncbi:unnamed protein product [Ceutorhynchus assimilis]|uniref:RING finger protein 113A n=1 Tax=Ceutorhynchus assimilis TaxID=467358 RepID=A0A9N9MIX4_9CUCU|nr:unnamed protein product [Ceutorhynchus assimilis]
MSESDKVEVGELCKFIFKKRTVKCQGMRKRPSNSSSEEDSAKSSTTKEKHSISKITSSSKKKFKANPNIQTSSGKKTKEKGISDSDSSDNDVMVSYKSKRSAMAEGPQDQGATAILEIETEKDRDAQAIFQKQLEINKELEGKEDDKVYRGLNNYQQFYKPKDTAAGNASSGMVRKGPIRAPDNIRTTVRWDYQPDICKDYKETGFCGFGDSCKFLHDRSDYKHGWQLEREWEEGTYGADSDDDKKYEIDSDEDKVPVECVICRKRFVDPVVSKCQHVFCEKCALEHYKKTTRCFVCKAQITIFNPARNVIARLKTLENEDNPKKEDSSDDD